MGTVLLAKAADHQHIADLVNAAVQTDPDSSEQMSAESSSDKGEVNLDAIIDAGGSFDDQSAADTSGVRL